MPSPAGRNCSAVMRSSCVSIPGSGAGTTPTCAPPAATRSSGYRSRSCVSLRSRRAATACGSSDCRRTLAAAFSTSPAGSTRRGCSRGLRIIDVGGGLGVPERPDQSGVDLGKLDTLLTAVRAEHPQLEVWLEPGRYLVAPAGVLLARVTQLKNKAGRRFVGVATGMNSLIRPALYGSYHEIVNLSRPDDPASELVSVVGPICESADVLGHDRLLPATREGDVLLIANVGAYGRTMSSEYNLRPPAVELFI